MDLYREIILDHYKHPRNFGELIGATNSSSLSNAVCGDRIVMQLKLEGTGDAARVADVRFSGEGCAVSQASASMLTEEILGKTVTEVMALTPKTVEDLLSTELTPSRVKCALLPLEAIQKALKS